MNVKIVAGTVAGLVVLTGGAIIAARMGAGTANPVDQKKLASAIQKNAPKATEPPAPPPPMIIDDRDLIQDTYLDNQADGSANDRGGFQRDGGRFGNPADFRAEMLTRFDKDGDGELNDDERQAAREAFRADREQRRQQWLLEQYDKDGDGVLSQAEQQQIEADREQQEAERQRREAEMHVRALAAYDTDGDGQLSEPEKQVARQQRREWFQDQRKQFIARFDTDGDGNIGDAERMTVRETMRSTFEEMRVVRQFDADGDNMITASDMKPFMDAFYQGSTEADFNHDGVIDEADLSGFQQLVTRGPSPDVTAAINAWASAPPPVDDGRGGWDGNPPDRRGGPDGGFRGRGGRRGGDRNGGGQQSGSPQNGAQQTGDAQQTTPPPSTQDGNG